MKDMKLIVWWCVVALLALTDVIVYGMAGPMLISEPSWFLLALGGAIMFAAGPFINFITVRWLYRGARAHINSIFKEKK
jgi:hypothetical protein